MSLCYQVFLSLRFVFHDNSSSKLDNRVEFPLTGLCLQPYVDNGDVSNNSEDYMYDLYGVVCHFGSKLLDCNPSFLQVKLIFFFL